MQDDIYNGFLIPKGSTIIGNSWGCLNDEHDFPEPERFYPDRFSDGKVLFNDVTEPRRFAFGYGRRCV